MKQMLASPVLCDLGKGQHECQDRTSDWQYKTIVICNDHSVETQQ